MRFQLDFNRRNVPTETLLNDLKAVASRIGKATVTIAEYDENGTYSSSALRNRFGGWSTVLEAAGLMVKHHNGGVRFEDAVADLQQTAAKLGKNTLTQAEYNTHGRFSSKPFINHFGSWNTALESVGLQHSKYYNISDDDLFGNLERIWRQLGRQPKYGEIVKPFSTYSSGTYEQRFGSWRKSLEAFVAFINAPLPSEASLEEIKPVALKQPATTRKTTRSVNWRLRFLVMRRDDFKCRQCGCSPAIKSGTVLVIDHVIPWAKGGETVFDNLQTLCEPCNGGKSDLKQSEK
jgi:hypothetical protein